MVARITRMTKRRLGELLRAEQLVTEDQLRAAQAEQRAANLLLCEALVKLSFVTEEQIAETIARNFNLPYLPPGQYNIAREMCEVFPERVQREYQFVVMDKLGSVIILAGAGLMNHDMLAELESRSRCRVYQYVGLWSDIRAALDSLYKGIKREEQVSEPTELGKLLMELDGPQVSKVLPAAGRLPTVMTSQPGVAAVTGSALPMAPALSGSLFPVTGTLPAAAPGVSAVTGAGATSRFSTAGKSAFAVPGGGTTVRAKAPGATSLRPPAAAVPPAAADGNPAGAPGGVRAPAAPPASPKPPEPAPDGTAEKPKK